MVRKLLLVLLLTLVAQNVFAEGPDWEGVGNPGDWVLTTTLATLDGVLYSTESSGYFYGTDPSSGVWQQIGGADYGATRFMVSANKKIYTIESDGSLYEIQPRGGNWRRIGPAGAWVNTIACTTLRGKLYSAETDGNFYVTDLNSGEWQQLGGNEFGATKYMFSANNRVYTIETDGSLYEIDPSDGSWRQIGATGDWLMTIALTVMDNKLYSAESTGALYVTHLNTGRWQQLGEAEYHNTKFMFSAGGYIYTIENDGSLYKIFLK